MKKELALLTLFLLSGAMPSKAGPFEDEELPKRTLTHKLSKPINQLSNEDKRIIAPYLNLVPLEEQDNFSQTLRNLWSEDMSSADKMQVVLTLAQIAPENHERFSQTVQDLWSEDMSPADKMQVVWTVSQVPPENYERFAQTFKNQSTEDDFYDNRRK